MPLPSSASQSDLVRDDLVASNGDVVPDDAQNALVQPVASSSTSNDESDLLQGGNRNIPIKAVSIGFITPSTKVNRRTPRAIGN